MIKKKSEKAEAIGASEIKNAESTIDAEQEEQEKAGIQQLEVTTTRWAQDQTVVLNKNPDLYYIFARKDDLIEMARCAKLGYEEAVGNEVIFGMKHPTPGKPKILNKQRILMCCPKAKVAARNEAKMSRLHAQQKHGNREKAEELQYAAGPKIGVSVFDGTQK